MPADDADEDGHFAASIGACRWKPRGAAPRRSSGVSASVAIQFPRTLPSKTQLEARNGDAEAVCARISRAQ